MGRWGVTEWSEGRVCAVSGGMVCGLSGGRECGLSGRRECSEWGEGMQSEWEEGMQSEWGEGMRAEWGQGVGRGYVVGGGCVDQDEGELGEVHEGLNRRRVGASVFLFVMYCNYSSGSLSVTSSILCTWG